MRNAHGTDHLHALLAFFLLFEQLSLTGDIAAVAFGCNILAECADRAACDDFSAYGALNGNLIHLARDFIFEAFAGNKRSGPGAFPVDDLRQCIDLFTVDQGYP